MPVSETDLELLETYLDEALPPSQIEPLRGRIAVEPELSAALTELNSQRAMRSAVWAALEPTDSAAQQMNWRLRGALAEQQRGGTVRFSSWWTARVGSVAAACVALGFFAGWMGHNNPAQTPSPSQIISNPAVATNDQPAPAPAIPVYVPLTNEYGQVVNWQQFPNAEQAKNFIDNMHQQQGNTVVSPADDKVKLVSEEKF